MHYLWWDFYPYKPSVILKTLSALCVSQVKYRGIIVVMGFTHSIVPRHWADKFLTTRPWNVKTFVNYVNSLMKLEKLVIVLVEGRSLLFTVLQFLWKCVDWSTRRKGKKIARHESRCWLDEHKNKTCNQMDVWLDYIVYAVLANKIKGEEPKCLIYLYLYFQDFWLVRQVCWRQYFRWC